MILLVLSFCLVFVLNILGADIELKNKMILEYGQNGSTSSSKASNHKGFTTSLRLSLNMEIGDVLTCARVGVGRCGAVSYLAGPTSPNPSLRFHAVDCTGCFLENRAEILSELRPGF